MTACVSNEHESGKTARTRQIYSMKSDGISIQQHYLSQMKRDPLSLDMTNILIRFYTSHLAQSENVTANSFY